MAMRKNRKTPQRKMECAPVIAEQHRQACAENDRLRSALAEARAEIERMRKLFLDAAGLILTSSAQITIAYSGLMGEYEDYEIKVRTVGPRYRKIRDNYDREKSVSTCAGEWI